MKVYIVLLLEYPDEGNGAYDSVEVVYTTLDADKAKDIETLWETVKKERYKIYYIPPRRNKMEQALQTLKDKYGINTWTGAELRVEEKELG